MGIHLHDSDEDIRAARERGRAKRQAWALRASAWLVLLGVGAIYAGRSFRNRALPIATEALASADRLTFVGGIVLAFGIVYLGIALRSGRPRPRQPGSDSDREGD